MLKLSLLAVYDDAIVKNRPSDTTLDRSPRGPLRVGLSVGLRQDVQPLALRSARVLLLYQPMNSLRIGAAEFSAWP